MKQRFDWLWAILVLAATACGCDTVANKVAEATPPPQAVVTNKAPAGPAGGYALLYDLTGSEKDVSKIRLIKHVNPDLKTLIKDISATNAAAHRQLEEFARADGAIVLKPVPLPAGENLARKAIANARKRELLTEKGQEFEVELLLTQNEALTYGGYLAMVTGLGESNPNRAHSLQEISTQLLGLQQRVLKMFLAHYNWVEQK